MNILFLYKSQISECKGGVQKVTLALSNKLNERGHNTYYLSQKRSEDRVINNQEFFLEDNDNPDGNELEYIFDFLKEKKIHVVVNQAAYGGGFSQLCKKIKKNIRVKIFSVIHNAPLGNVNNFFYSHPNVTKKLSKYKLGFLTKGTFVLFILKQLYIAKYRKSYRTLYKNSDRVVLLSESFIPDFSKFIGRYIDNRVIVISNPSTANIGLNSQICKKNEVLFVGRLDTTQKKVDFLLSIWSKFSEEFPNWKLNIVGDGQERGELEGLVTKGGLRNVHFHGFQEPTTFYQQASILCLTSSYEGFGLVLVEAQRYGTVPIAFNSFNSINDIISNNENGVLIEPFNIEQYVDALKKLAIDSELREYMRYNAIESSKKFDLDSICDIWVDEFNCK